MQPPINDPRPLTADEVYKAAAAAACHYSGLVRHLRTLAAFQGLAALGAASYLFSTGHMGQAVAASLFGAFFTVCLLLIHEMYFKYADTAINFAAESEKGNGVWSAINKVRVSKRRFGWIKTRSIYLLLLSAQGIVLLAGVVGACISEVVAWRTG